MSKVQDAINKGRMHSQGSGRVIMHDSLIKSATRPPAALMRLKNGTSLALDPKQMERSCVLPFIGDKGAINAYKLLRTRLLQRMRDNQWKSLMVSGAMPSDGKTTTAINVAIGASQDVSQSVLLVDMDLERPGVADSLGLQRTSGLSDYLSGEADLNDIVYKTDVESLFILPNFESFLLSGSLISPRMLALLDHIKQLDPNLLIVFDMPPILSSDSVLAFGPHVDSLLLVVSEGSTRRNLLERASQMIEDIPRVGTVMNRSTEGNSVGYY